MSPITRTVLIDADETGVPINTALNYHFYDTYSKLDENLMSVDFTNKDSIPDILEPFLIKEAKSGGVIPDIYISKDFCNTIITAFESDVALLRRCSSSREDPFLDEKHNNHIDIIDGWESLGIRPALKTFCASFYPKDGDFTALIDKNNFMDVFTASPTLAKEAIGITGVRIFFMITNYNYKWFSNNIENKENVFPASNVFGFYLMRNFLKEKS